MSETTSSSAPKLSTTRTVQPPAACSPRNACDSKVQLPSKARPRADVADELADRAVGRDQADLHVADIGGREGHLDRHPLDPVVEPRVAGEAAPRGIAVGDRRRAVEQVDRLAGLVGAGRRRRAGREPGLRQPHRRERIDESVAVVVREVLPAAVPGLRPVPGPGVALLALRALADLRPHLARRGGEDRLHVAPAEARVGLVHQRHHAADHRRRRRGAVEGPGVVGRVVAGPSGPVGRHHLPGRAEGRNQDRGAVARIDGDVAGLVDRRDDDLAGVVGPGVGVHVVAVEARVAGSLDDGHAEPAAAGLDRRSDRSRRSPRSARPGRTRRRRWPDRWRCPGCG